MHVGHVDVVTAAEASGVLGAADGAGEVAGRRRERLRYLSPSGRALASTLSLILPGSMNRSSARWKYTKS